MMGCYKVTARCMLRFLTAIQDLHAVIGSDLDVRGSAREINLDKSICWAFFENHSYILEQRTIFKYKVVAGKNPLGFK